MGLPPVNPSGLTGAPVAVGVAASAGGVEALSSFVRGLPADFPATVLVVLHIPETGPSVLPGILARCTELPVIHAEDGTPLKPGVVIVAPPGQHLKVREGFAEIDRGPREHGHRPSADALFRTLAIELGPRSAGAVLSGTMDDGAAGLRLIGLAGGMTLVQDPNEAAFPGMPRAAMSLAAPSVVCSVKEMGQVLSSWANNAATRPEEGNGRRAEREGAKASMSEVSVFTCPDCGGTLWLDTSLGTDRFRCRVGHEFSANALMAGKENAVEAALWAAIVALEERSDLVARLLKRMEPHGRPNQLSRYREEIELNAERVDALRALITELIQNGVSLQAEGEVDGADPTP